MDWIQVFTIVVSVFGLFLWSRRESASEIREIRKEVKEFQNKIAKMDERWARLDEKYQNFVTSLFSNFSKDDLKQAAKKTGIK